MTTQENKQMQHGKTFRCTRLRLLEHLNNNGFYPFATVPEISTGGRYKNWLFHNSWELEQCIYSYFDSKK